LLLHICCERGSPASVEPYHFSEHSKAFGVSPRNPISFHPARRPRMKRHRWPSFSRAHLEFGFSVVNHFQSLTRCHFLPRAEKWLGRLSSTPRVQLPPGTAIRLEHKVAGANALDLRANVPPRTGMGFAFSCPRKFKVERQSAQRPLGSRTRQDRNSRSFPTDQQSAGTSGFGQSRHEDVLSASLQSSPDQEAAGGTV